jgi:hypothetical protein
LVFSKDLEPRDLVSDINAKRLITAGFYQVEYQRHGDDFQWMDFHLA